MIKKERSEAQKVQFRMVQERIAEKHEASRIAKEQYKEDIRTLKIQQKIEREIQKDIDNYILTSSDEEEIEDEVNKHDRKVIKDEINRKVQKKLKEIANLDSDVEEEIIVKRKPKVKKEYVINTQQNIQPIVNKPIIRPFNPYLHFVN
jgi:hypothetical protein